VASGDPAIHKTNKFILQTSPAQILKALSAHSPPEEARTSARTELRVSMLSRAALWFDLPFPALSEGIGCSLMSTSQRLIKSIRKLVFSMAALT